MRALALVGLLIAVSGCSSLKTTSGAGAGSAQTPPPVAVSAPATPPPAAPPPVAPAPVAPAPVAPPPVAPPPVAPPPVAPPPVAAPPVAAPPVAPPPVAPPPRAAAAPAKSPVAARPAKQTAAAAAQSPAPPPAPPAAETPATLNLADLEQRLRETRAIGVFTKLSLKNQVDDLLKAFRALYRDPNKRPSAELRQRYDGLLLKVLSLLQDGDPPLAAAIASSREAIWSILADPEKFAKMDT